MKNYRIIQSLCVLLLLVLSYSTSAQKNFRPGFIISTSGDTLFGQIDYKAWDVNPTTFAFIKTGESTVNMLGPSSVMAFYVEGDLYESYYTDIDMTPYNPDILKDNKGRNWTVRDSLFLRVLVQGNISLLSYKDGMSKSHFYYQINSDVPEELLYKYKYIDSIPANSAGITSGRGIQKVEFYKGQLIVLLQKCPQMRRDISLTRYYEKNIISLMKKYFACTHESYSLVRKSEKTRFVPGIVCGMDWNKINFYGDNPYSSLEEADFKVSASPVVGLSLDIIFPRNNNRFSLNNQLVMRRLNTSASYKGAIDGGYRQDSLKFDMYYTELVTTFRYQFLQGTVRPFLTAGFANAYAVSTKNSCHINQLSYGYYSEWDGPALKSPRRYEFSEIAGAGVMLKNFSAEVLYESGNGMSQRCRTNRINLMFGYRF